MRPQGQVHEHCSRWPDGAHASHILRASQVWDVMESGDVDGFILGDSGYSCRNWLKTPLLNPNGNSNLSNQLGTLLGLEGFYGINLAGN